VRRALFVLAAAALLPGCDDDLLPSINLERMIEQSREKTYGEAPYFSDGRAMRSPPAESVPVTRSEPHPGMADAEAGGGYLIGPAVPITRGLLTTGQDRFETYCAACHGVRGDGASMVAASMPLRRPPSLIGARVQGFPDGKIYQIIVLGYGLMRPYTEDLTTPEERWATVAYLRALQLSQGVGVALDSLSPEARRRAEQELH
jgi:mono/diheme cytochrome c family protein